MRFLTLTLILLLSVTFIACDDDDEVDDEDPSAATPADGAQTPAAGGADLGDVDVELVDFSVIAAPSGTSPGEVTFNIENTGPDHAHEFVLIRTDLDAANLPTNEDGSVDEDAPELDVVDEVEEIEVGGSEALTVDLESGSYALICNIVAEHEGETNVHYALGMRTNFTVQ